MLAWTQGFDHSCKTSHDVEKISFSASLVCHTILLGKYPPTEWDILGLWNEWGIINVLSHSEYSKWFDRLWMRNDSRYTQTVYQTSPKDVFLPFCAWTSRRQDFIFIRKNKERRTSQTQKASFSAHSSDALHSTLGYRPYFLPQHLELRPILSTDLPSCLLTTMKTLS